MGGAYLLLLGLLIVLEARIPPRLAWRSLLARLIVFGGSGLLMVGPWYGRSLTFTGNPVWPFLFQILGGKTWDALGHEQRVIRFEQYDEPEELAEDLSDLGITHILDNPHWLYTGLRHWDHDRALMLELERSCGEEIGAWDEIVLYGMIACRD